MVYKAEPEKLGLVISIGTHRKHGNGAVGGGRNSSTGKMATVVRARFPPVTITAPTRKELMRKLRKQFNIPPGLVINERGVTEL